MKRVDVFPAIIRLAPPGSFDDITELGISGPSPKGTRKLDRCRVVILKDVLMVALDSPTGPSLVFRERVTDTVFSGKTTHAVTESGKIVVFEKDDNCGCGSRLRSWNPYGNIVMSTKDPE